MKRKIQAFLCVIAFSGLALLSPGPFACGPFFEQPIFTTLLYPDMPVERYVGGDLGIVQPTYARVYLYVAYRHLAGTPFPPEERKAVLAYWEPDSVVPPPPGKNQYGGDKEWVDYWLEIRDSFPELKEKHSREQIHWPGYLAYRQMQNYQSYLNCPQDAFRTAVLTFKERKRVFGAESTELREWVTGQDQVFANCQSGTTLPQLAQPAWPALLRADRAYQMASAHFYSEDFDTAGTLFESIASDPNSPWQSWGEYLAARCSIRKATLTRADGLDWKALGEAEGQLRSILEDPKQTELHTAARRLLAFVEFRLRPVERGRELAASLVDTQKLSTRRQDLADYKVWLDNVYERTGYSSLRGLETNESAAAAIAELRAASELTDWIVAMQGGEAELAHAIERWRATQSAPWLIAALSKLRANHAQTSELLAVSEKISAEAPAFLTAAYHRLRLLLEAGQHDRARAELEAVLAPRKRMPVSARNAFLAMRMKLARNLAELLRFAPRSQAAEGNFGTDDYFAAPDSSAAGSEAAAQYLDADGSRILTEKLPTAILREAAASTTLPAAIRDEIALAAWTRAILLDDLEMAAALSPSAGQIAPELRQPLESFRAAQSREEKRFAAAFLLLRFPGLRPFVAARIPRSKRVEEMDSLRDNWWCSFGPQRQTDFYYNYYRMWLNMRGPLLDLYPGDDMLTPDFLTPAQKQAAAREWQKLESLPGAPHFLGEIVLAWARQHADDPRVPEALHRVVRATRLGCTDVDSGRLSRSAFQLLHRGYPQSEWAKKTPYWYE